MKADKSRIRQLGKLAFDMEFVGSLFVNLVDMDSLWFLFVDVIHNLWDLLVNLLTWTVCGTLFVKVNMVILKDSLFVYVCCKGY